MATSDPDRIASALRMTVASKPLWIEASGGSMGRAIVTGSEVLVAPATVPRRGEVWAFCADDGRLVVHRFRGRHGSRFVFEGDATNRADRPVAASRVVGRVIAVRAEGHVRRFGRADAFLGSARVIARRLRRLRRRAHGGR